MWQFDNANSISIPESADMKSSTYLVPGVYKCDTNIRASTLKNCPCDAAFTLFVYKSLAKTAAYILQEFRTLYGTVYKRQYSGYEQDVQSGNNWGHDVAIAVSHGLGINEQITLSSGSDIRTQVGETNNFTRLVVRNNYFAVEHYTNGQRDKSKVLWDGN